MPPVNAPATVVEEAAQEHELEGMMIMPLSRLNEETPVQ
jgi:hypothetical protein